MSSWNTGGAPQKPIRLGYKQLQPEGRFLEKNTPATIVSAYYPMKSKHSLENYKQWIQRFLKTFDTYLVFFTEESQVDFVKEHRANYMDKTEIIVLPREQWIASTKFPQGFWEAQTQQDPESQYHTPELYKVWYEKKEFVLRAIEKNPFQTTDFVWCDAGIIRYQSLVPLVKHFPVANRIPVDKMLLLNVQPFTRNDEVVKIIEGESIVGGASGKPRIGGGVLAASADVWKAYSKLYDEQIEKFMRAKLFVGKDQTIMTTLVLEHKPFFSLIDCKLFFFDMWLFAPVWLGCSQKLFTFLKKEPWYGRKRSIEDLVFLS